MECHQTLESAFEDHGFNTDGFKTLGREADLSTRILGWVDVGSPDFNAVLGDPKLGIPLGRIIGIIGGESHGKSTFMYWLAGKCQKAGGLVFFSDEEGSYREDWCSKLGVDADNIIPITLGERLVIGKSKDDESKKKKKETFEPEGLEDLFEKAELAALTMKSDFPDVPCFILLDSIAATPTRKELAGDYGNEAIAESARVISRGLKKLSRVLIGSKVSFIYINQLRTKIGGYGPVTNTMNGGRALRYYSSVIVEVVRTATRSNYITCLLKNKKNKLAHPFKTVNFKINFDEGIVV